MMTHGTHLLMISTMAPFSLSITPTQACLLEPGMLTSLVMSLTPVHLRQEHIQMRKIRRWCLLGVYFMKQFSIICFKDIQMRLTLVKPASNQMTLILNKYFYYLGFEAVSSESVHYSVSTQQLTTTREQALSWHGYEQKSLTCSDPTLW